MNDYMMRHLLKPNEEFESVESIFVYAKTLDDITLKMHKFARKHVLRPDFQNVIRPVLLNNWEATYMKFKESNLKRIINKAKDLKLEMFVLDDGWFGTRIFFNR